MKRLFTTCLFLTLIQLFCSAQNLELIFAEKFDFNRVYYSEDTGFDPAIMCNGSFDLDYYNVDLNTEGKKAGALFFHEDEESEYIGTFIGESDVQLLDININWETEHQTILLDVDGPCIFVGGGQDDTLSFNFPLMENMTGISNFTDRNGVDSFWLTYILATEANRQNLWTIGDLTLISGTATENDLRYVNPDQTIENIEVFGGFNHYIIAIDDLGFYKWSHVTRGVETGVEIMEVVEVLPYEDHMMITTSQAFINGGRSSSFTYLDFQGEEVREKVELMEVIIRDLAIDDFGKIMMCGSYNKEAEDTNFDLNGGAYFLNSEDIGEEGPFFNGFFIQYNESGQVEWSQTLAGGTQSVIAGFDYTDDNVFLTGQVSTDATLRVSGENVMDFEEIDEFQAFTSKFSREGEFKWLDIFDSGFWGLGDKLTLINDDVFLFGSFISSFDANLNPDEVTLLTNENFNNPRSYFAIHLEEIEVASSKDIDRKVSIVSPNPASTYLTAESSDILILELKDMNGRTMEKFNSSRIDISSIPNGMYVVTTDQKGERKNQLVSIIH
ncbi:MAG: T9SS type A sorting domain-containing protein [Bacteroidota bacterium]